MNANHYFAYVLCCIVVWLSFTSYSMYRQFAFLRAVSFLNMLYANELGGDRWIFASEAHAESLLNNPFLITEKQFIKALKKRYFNEA
jgi:hypothetical protein